MAATSPKLTASERKALRERVDAEQRERVERERLAELEDKQSIRKRQFVVRLDQPGLYDDLSGLAHHVGTLEQRSVPMTDLAREAIADYCEREKRKYGL